MKIEFTLILAICILFATSFGQEPRRDNSGLEKTSRMQIIDVINPLEPIGNWSLPQKDQTICSILTQDIPLRELGIHGILVENEMYKITVYLNDSSEEDINKLRSFDQNLRAYRRDIIEMTVNLTQLKLIENLYFVSYTNVPRFHYGSKADSSNIIKPDLPNCTRDVLGICALQEQNVLGTGVTVAILDSEFYCNRLIELELPKNITLISDRQYSENERHGTACAELITNIAPNINLYLVDAGRTDFDFINAVKKINNLGKKVDIILCCRDFFSGSFNGDDEVCEAIREITSKGTIWINAAGDMALRHWIGNFTDPDKNKWNNFNQDDENITFTAKRGDRINLWLSWLDRRINAVQDYDLFLFTPDGKYGISNNPQSGHYGHEPVETILTIAPSSGVYSIKIKRLNTTKENVQFQLFCSHNLDKHGIPTSSLGIMASCPEALAVGAVDFSSLKIEPYSSKGPTIYGKIKPDLVAPDNVSTLTYWPKKFRGTSAAAPNVAGCFALAMEKLKNKSLNLNRILISNAKDLGPIGSDSVYGNGLINLSFLR